MKASLLIFAVATLSASLAQAEIFARRDVARNTSASYEKECGSCHFPYQPGWLPERSWRRIMETLRDHFGENAEVKTKDREALLAYLVAGSAERAKNLRSYEQMQAIPPGETPIRITQLQPFAGNHWFIHPDFKGKPEVKTMAQCPVCHLEADSARFSRFTYEVTDEGFRTDDVDLTASMPVPDWLKPRKKK